MSAFQLPFPLPHTLSSSKFVASSCWLWKGQQIYLCHQEQENLPGLGQFLKIKKNLGPMFSHLCTYNLLSSYNCALWFLFWQNLALLNLHPIQKCEFKHEFKILGIDFGGGWCLISHSLEFTWPNICILKMKGRTHTEIFFHELCFKE